MLNSEKKNWGIYIRKKYICIQKNEYKEVKKGRETTTPSEKNNFQNSYSLREICDRFLITYWYKNYSEKSSCCFIFSICRFEIEANTYCVCTFVELLFIYNSLQILYSIYIHGGKIGYQFLLLFFSFQRINCFLWRKKT